jgi:hypothetical protein
MHAKLQGVGKSGNPRALEARDRGIEARLPDQFFPFSPKAKTAGSEPADGGAVPSTGARISVARADYGPVCKTGETGSAPVR